MSVIGTPEFMAPEFYNETYNEKVDIWAFGLCIIEIATLEYPYKECTNVGSVYRTVSSGLKPQALAKIKNENIIEFICCCIEEDVSIRWSSAELLNHPFLSEDAELDTKYITLNPEEELSQVFQIIGSPPTKQGWETWISKIVTPIREHRKRKIHSPQQLNLSTEDTVLANTANSEPILLSRNSERKLNIPKPLPDDFEDDVLLEPYPTPPINAVTASTMTSAPSNPMKLSDSNNTNRVPHTISDTRPNRLDNQITKNWEEFSNQKQPSSLPATSTTGISISTGSTMNITFTQNPNNTSL